MREIGLGHMKPASRDAIIEEFERAFVFVGAKDYDSGMATFGKILRRVDEHYHPMRSRSDLAAMLDSLPEPSWMRMRFMLGTLRHLPHLLRFGFTRLAEKAESDLPPIPSGRPGLDAFSKEQIIAHVGKRHMEGYTLDQAKRAAAKQFAVSEASVQRAWDDRGNRGAVDFRSVLKFLKEDMKDRSDVLDAIDRVDG